MESTYTQYLGTALSRYFLSFIPSYANRRTKQGRFSC